MADAKRKAVGTGAFHGKGARNTMAGRVLKNATAARQPKSAVIERGGASRTLRLSHAQERTAFLIEAFGSASAVAELLEVSRSQPGRWKSGVETPGPAASALLVDLDHVMARATLLWPTEVAKRWLVGSEPFLGGARPIDALRLRGSREVIEALDAVTSGAYA